MVLEGRDRDIQAGDVGRHGVGAVRRRCQGDGGTRRIDIGDDDRWRQVGVLGRIGRVSGAGGKLDQRDLARRRQTDRKCGSLSLFDVDRVDGQLTSNVDGIGIRRRIESATRILHRELEVAVWRSTGTGCRHVLERAGIEVGNADQCAGSNRNAIELQAARGGQRIDPNGCQGIAVDIAESKLCR